MTTVRQYGAALRPIARRVALRLGMDLENESMPVRVATVTSLAVVCAVGKLLVDKGLVTDAELLAAIRGLDLETFDPEPEEPEYPPTDPYAGLTVSGV